MTLIEKIVRPFQTTGVTPPKRFLSTTQFRPPEEVVIELGKTGQTKTFSGSAESTVTAYMDANHSEKKKPGNTFENFKISEL